MKNLIVHSQQIPPEGQQFACDLDLDWQDVENQEVQNISPLHCDFDVGLDGSGFWAQGSLSCEAQFLCVRCLETFQGRVEVENFALFKELPSGARDHVVDLTEDLREEILLVFPAHPNCGAQCQGPKVTEVLREVAEEPDEDPWDELKKLGLKPGQP
ncbi:MAG: DUF177 domain-containing protein [Verrucomicrobiales bacterium]